MLEGNGKEVPEGDECQKADIHKGIIMMMKRNNMNKWIMNESVVPTETYRKYVVP